MKSGGPFFFFARVSLSTLIDRLPIHIVGAVLNDVRATGAYRYYSYLYGYTSEEETQAQLTDGNGSYES